MKRLFSFSLVLLAAAALASPGAAAAAPGTFAPSGGDVSAWLFAAAAFVGVGIATNVDDFVVYQEQYRTGMQETLAEAVDLFNAQSMYALVLEESAVIGELVERSFFRRIPNLVNNRDTRSNAEVEDKHMTQGELVSPKVNFRIGPFATTYDKWIKAGGTMQQASYLFGRQAGVDVRKEMLYAIIGALQASIRGYAEGGENPLVVTVDGPLNRVAMNKALFRYGARRSDIVAFLAHSGAMEGMTEKQLGEKLEAVAGPTAYGGSPATLNKPVVEADNENLTYVDAEGNQRYRTMGLVENAGVVSDAEASRLGSEEILGHENMGYRIQGEGAYVIESKGFAFNKEEVDPDEATYTSPANWNSVMTSRKDLAGVIIDHA